jgi:hypothetical protein
MSKVCCKDITMLRLLKRGDKMAFEAIFRKYYAKIYHCVKYILLSVMPNGCYFLYSIIQNRSIYKTL